MSYQEFRIGETVGIYTVLEFLGGDQLSYFVKCNLCSEKSVVRSYRLGTNRYCIHCKDKNRGLRVYAHKYSSGQIVGNDTIVRYAPEAGKSYYLVKCNTCNTERILQTYLIGKANRCYSCVVMGILVDGVASTDHYLMVVREGMLARCYISSDIGFKYYGARGITVCDRWRCGENDKSGFECFVKDVHKEIGLRPNMASVRHGDYKEGFGPKSYHLGRINHEKPYGPGNVRWETAEESARDGQIRKKETKLQKQQFKKQQELELEQSGPWLSLPAEELNGYANTKERISAWERL